MGKTKRFFEELQEGQQYVNLSVDNPTFMKIRHQFTEGKDYELHFIKEKQTKYKESELWKAQYKKYIKEKNKLVEIEQNINHA